MVAEIRQAIADALTARIPGVQWSPYMLGRPVPPSGHLFPAPIDYDKAMSRGLDEWTFTLQVWYAELHDIAAQVQLDKLLEPSGQTSVKEAVEADPTLGGLVIHGGVDVTSCTGYQRYQLESGAPVLGAEWTLIVRPEKAGG